LGLEDDKENFKFYQHKRIGIFLVVNLLINELEYFWLLCSQKYKSYRRKSIIFSL
jgi:hypothetical protein